MGFGILKQPARFLLSRVPVRAFERLSTYAIQRQNFAQVMETPAFAQREAMWNYFFDALGLAISRIALMEFGVFKGYSLRHFAGLNRHTGSEFWGFDSFEGLPEVWTRTKPQGHFARGGTPPELDDPRIRFVQGYFSKTVPAFISANAVRIRDEFECPPVVHFDADLYSSTMLVLDKLTTVFPTILFIADDFMIDEVRAFRNFSQMRDVAYRFVAHTVRDLYPCRVCGVIQRNPE